MSTFQFIVVPLALIVALSEMISWSRGGGRIRFLKSIVWLAFAGAVYKPNLVQTIATLAGIGRGTDLLLYGLTLFTLLSTFHFLDRLEMHRRDLTLLIRELAIQHPRWPVSQAQSSIEPQRVTIP